MEKQFFDEQAEQSQVKTAIVAKYFVAWAKVITGYQKTHGEKTRIAYIDLFAGPGRYKDGANFLGTGQCRLRGEASPQVVD